MCAESIALADQQVSGFEGGVVQVVDVVGLEDVAEPVDKTVAVEVVRS